MTIVKTNVDLLKRDEELRLVTMAQSEGRRQGYALDRLVRANAGLVHKLVQRFPLKNAVVTYDDLFQVGMIGFLHAVELFDTERGIRLSTYAYRWIHAYIQRYWQNCGRVVRVPAHLSDKFYANKKVVEELTTALGRSPLPEDLPDTIRQVASHFTPTVSLNITLNDNGEEIGDLQSDSYDHDLKIEVESYLKVLRSNVSERDYNILVLRYGLHNQHEHSLQELSNIFGVSRARIHQVVHSNLSVLRSVTSS